MGVWVVGVGGCGEKALGVRYVTSYIYEAISKQGDDCFGVMFERTKLIEPLACGFDDVWCSEWLENPELFAVREAGQVIALMEICMESWTQRLRISNIYVTPAYRGRGCATLLLQHSRSWRRSAGFAVLYWKHSPATIPRYSAICETASYFWGAIFLSKATRI